MRTVIAYLIYIPVQIAALPLTIVGATMIFYTQMFVSRRLGVSSTAIEIINGRWTMDRFGLRKDHATVKLFQALPNTTAVGQWLTLTPLYILQKISGKHLIYPNFKKAPEAGLANLVTTRTVYFDQILEQSFKTSEQFVVLGAGFDTRCFGSLPPATLIKRFELDKKNTQDLKIKALKKGGIDLNSTLFVNVDFNTESWAEKLQEAGYDSTKKTTFLWEGVSLYLSAKQVHMTLQEIQKNGAKGSVIVADFYGEDFVKGKRIKGTELMELTQEEFGYGITFQGAGSQELHTLAKDCQLQLGKVHYMGSALKKGTWMCVSELIL
ncbi:MAG: class I SAM-dependent methyltransferase [Flavobacteriaceae bacterium]